MAIAPTPVKKEVKRSSLSALESAWNSQSSELSGSAMNPSMLVAVKYCVMATGPVWQQVPTLHRTLQMPAVYDIYRADAFLLVAALIWSCMLQPDENMLVSAAWAAHGAPEQHIWRHRHNQTGISELPRLG